MRYRLPPRLQIVLEDRKSTRLNSSHSQISYAVFCLKKKKKKITRVAYVNPKQSTLFIIRTRVFTMNITSSYQSYDQPHRNSLYDRDDRTSLVLAVL